MTITAAAGFAVTAAALLTAWTSAVTGARILAVFPYNGHSHFVMVEPLLVALSERGHHVTVISPFPRQKDRGGRGGDRYVDVDVSDALPPFISRMDTSDFESSNPVSGLRDLCHMNHRVCEATFGHPRVRRLIRQGGPYDAVLAEAFSTDCYALFAHAFDAPLVSVRTSESSPQLNRRAANPQHPAYLVGHLLPYDGRGMSFAQRLINALATHLGAVGYHAFADGLAAELAERHFGPGTPSAAEVASARTALVLVNSHHGLTQSRPLAPNVVEVGGMHVVEEPERPAANEWTAFCDSCDQGVVYVSFGSLLKGSPFSDHLTAAFVRAFETLPYCVLWKYEGDIGSKRIKTSKWMPQQQILGHENVKAFVTHGGLMGVMEAVHFGVPMVGIPVFGDQQKNVANCVDKGMAISLDHRKINEHILVKSIGSVVEDKKFRLKALETSARFKDRPMSALETAVFWTEYVINHGNSTNIASPAIHLDFYQYCLLDIVAVTVSTLSFFLYFGYRIYKLV